MTVISDGKLFTEREGTLLPRDSLILRKYISAAKESARQREWKYSGEGARFTGSFIPRPDPDAAAELYVRVTGAGYLSDGTLLYAMQIDRAAGIYSVPPDGGEEGIFLSDNEYRYRELAVRDDRILVTAEAAGECHIGLLEKGSRVCEFLTEGSSREACPFWSLLDPDAFFFSGAGLEERMTEEPTGSADKEMSVAELIGAMRQTAQPRRVGPAGLFRMNLRDRSIEELLTDERYNCISPTEDVDGGIWFIRYPYRPEKRDKKSFGTALKDVVLFPVRLLGGLFGFLNFFTMKYSGKTLNSGTTASKNKPQSERFVLGNLIDAERELKRNAGRGEEFPGYVPKEYELCRLKDGRIDTAARGICAFTLYKGRIYASNGSYILTFEQGRPQKRCKAEGVSAICFSDREDEKGRTEEP